MFYNCSSIKEITMTSLNFSKALYMDHMFGGCDKTTIINIAEVPTIDYSRLITAEDFDGEGGYLSLRTGPHPSRRVPATAFPTLRYRSIPTTM